MTKSELPDINVMIDLETFDLVPGGIILSIGACTFATGQERKIFHNLISVADSRARHYTEDRGTMAWWHKQPLQTMQEATAGTDSVPIALVAFSDWLHTLSRDENQVKIWGNASTFDNVILAAAYRKEGIKQPWGKWSDRCYRTLKNLLPHAILDKRTSTKHNALEDAKWQADHAELLLRML